MAYMMSDLATGSTAVRALQQNVLGAQYDPANIAAAAEENQLKLQQDRIKAAYAPQEAELKVKQEQQSIDQTRLSNLVNQSKIDMTAEKKAAITKITSDPEYSKLSPADQSRKLAAAVMAIDSADGERFTRIADSENAKELVNKLKEHEVNRQNIGDALATVRGASDDQFQGLVEKMPEDMKKAIKMHIPGFFEEKNPKLQKSQLEALMNNGEGKNNMAANEQRLKVLELQIEKAEASLKVTEQTLENIRARGANIKEAGKNIKEKAASKSSAKDDKEAEAEAKREDRQYGQFRRDSRSIDFEYKRPVQEATDAFKRAVRKDEEKTGIFSAFGGGSSALEETKGDSKKREQLASTKAWRELQELKKEVVEKKLIALDGMPEGKEKDRIYNALVAEMESIDTSSYGPTDKRKAEGKLEKSGDAPAKDSKSNVPSGAGATSNKPPKSLGVPPKEMLDKANAAIQQGADPKEVLKRLQDKGYDVQFTKEK